MSSAICLNLDQSKILSSGNRLITIFLLHVYMYIIVSEIRDRNLFITLPNNPEF